MSIARLCALLCVSTLFVANAAADEAAPFVTQLRLPARESAIDVFAWREGQTISVSRGDLQRLSLSIPASVGGDRVPLSTIPGLSYLEDTAASAITITCTASCFAVQRVNASTFEPTAQTQRAFGAYLNYDLDAQWLGADSAALAGLGEASVFGAWGLFESSWLGRTGGASVARLETRWTYDFPRQRVRLRFGDSAMGGVGGAMVRFAGVQVGRHFGLEPSLITYPTPLLAGEADRASTVELYVDGALRARDKVDAGPFVFDSAPLVSGSGDAQLVVTDVLGRQQVISRPFFVSMSLLRPGFTDWSFAAGAVRDDFGRRSSAYGANFTTARYRIGVTNGLTMDSAVETSPDNNNFELGATMAHVVVGQVRVARAEGAHGGATALSWFQDGDGWAAGVQTEVWDGGFKTIGFDDTDLRRSVAANFSVDFGRAGAAALTAAAVDYVNSPRGRTITLSYTPDFASGSLSARITHTQRESSDLSFALSFRVPFGDGLSSTFGLESDRRGATYRASTQRAADGLDSFGWRSRAMAGREQRLEFSGSRRGQYGDTTMQAARTRDAVGARVSHSGSVGWIDRYAFAGRPIHGAFAIIDAGAQNVGVLRDRMRVGATGRDGRILAVDLRPYDSNMIAIATDDLPLDRAPATTQVHVSPTEGAGVVVRFATATEILAERVARFDNGAPPQRGSILVRVRDGARFPVGSEGRVVLIGGVAGDVLRLSGDERCIALIAAASDTITLTCAAAMS